MRLLAIFPNDSEKSFRNFSILSKQGPRAVLVGIYLNKDLKKEITASVNELVAVPATLPILFAPDEGVPYEGVGYSGVPYEGVP